ncbi:F-box/LRR-repeat protein At5g35995-like [Rutidosis leptorrhynchoides]|uniref:F-box/LRR-repeat protein At5g35995-like n=1 Tax=Rutidosis leptorrhynchoides TaxID=125765 RepID=UPI003A99AB0A
MAKHSSAANNCHVITKKQRIETDIISQLPDDLLIRILSLLPAADATRSLFLSNWWKHLYAFHPNLHLVMPEFEEQANKYIDSVEQTLALGGGTPIRKLFLQSDYPYYDYRVNIWLRDAEELEFRFYTFDDTFYQNMFRFCTYTLIKLTLEGSRVWLKPEIKITFPCLKEMNLQCIESFDTKSLMVLLSGCPVLEDSLEGVMQKLYCK